MRNRNTEGFGLQNKGVGWFGRVPLDKLERFTISWIGFSVLGMLRFEPFQVTYSGNGNRGLTGHCQTGEGGG